MSDQYLGEIRVFPFNFAPVGWSLCNGALLPVPQYTALFSIIGTAFGGDGRTTFALPNMQGNVPVGIGQGTGLSPYSMGDTGGSQTVTLQDSQSPSHNHPFNVSAESATTPNPSGAVYAKGVAVGVSSSSPLYPYTTTTPTATLKLTTLSQSGGNQPHNNMMSFLVLNFCIALQGIFPARP